MRKAYSHTLTLQPVCKLAKVDLVRPVHSELLPPC